MTGLFQEPDDATPLAPPERDGLLQSWITHRRDLNDAEQQNILHGAAWARGRRSRQPVEMLGVTFAQTLHRRMFGEVWRWAGTYRQTPRNIGIEAYRIGPEMAALLDDVKFWIAHKTYPPDEIAVRLHHRLVVIHPFPNGNGRHARMMADLLMERLGGRPFSWGGGSLINAGDLRRTYITALRAADNHDLGPLVAFAHM